MDKLDAFMIPFVYVFRLTLILVSTIVLIPYSIWNFTCSLYHWILILLIYPLLFVLEKLHTLVRIPVNMFIQSLLYRTISYWPKFYWSLFKPKEGRRSIWKIITNPIPDTGPRPKQPGRIVCLKDTYYCHSYYQTQGAYAHLNQKGDKDLEEAVEAASIVMYYDDPLRLSIPYEFLHKRLPKPPDGIIKASLTLGAILIIYAIPIFKGLIRLWIRLLAARLCTRDDRNIFVQYGRRRRPKTKEIPSLHIKVFATKKDSDENAFSWDSDGIPFVIDNSATGIISNVRKLFVGPLTPTRVTLQTAEGLKTKLKYVGVMRLVLTDNANKHHTYDIPNCVFDPESPINICGIPFLGEFFGDQAKNSCITSEDGTRVTSGSTKSHFVWDHGKHERHFFHGSSRLPELYLYVGHGYFNAFCTRVRKYMDDKVLFAFSSAFTIDPSLCHGVPSPEGDSSENVEENPGYQWYCPETSGTPVTNSTKNRPNNKPHKTHIDFELGMDLNYVDGKGNKVPCVYEGASASGLVHTVRLKDGSKQIVHDSKLHLLQQPSFGNIPKTPLDYRNEVGQGLSLEEAQALARPQQLSPLQQELMSWHHRLYHLPFRLIFALAKAGFLPKRLTELRNNAPVCIACQFGQAHRRPWRTKGKKNGSIRRPEHKEPGDGVSVDQIISAQPGLIPQMTAF